MAQYGSGQIILVKCKDFLTYNDEVTVHFGSGLNLIIGPNGSGKSTLITAICFALGGKTSMFDSERPVSSYINNLNDGTKETGYVEVHLSHEALGRIKIRRVIRRDNTSKYYVGGKPSDHKGVQKIVVDDYKIHIDNLTQCLPQDKTRQFQLMKPEKKLIEIQKALGNDMSGAYDELCVAFDDSKNVMKDLTDLANRKEKLEGEVANLKRQVDKFRRWEHADRKMKLLQKRLPVARMEKIHARSQGAREQKKLLVVELKELQAELRPFELEAVSLKANEQQMDRAISKSHAELDKLKTKHKTVTEQSGDYARDLDSAWSAIQNHEKRIKKAKDKLDAAVARYDEAREEAENIPPEAPLRRQIQDLSKDMQARDRKVQPLKNKMRHIDGEFRKLQNELESAKRHLSGLNPDGEFLEQVNAMSQINGYQNFRRIVDMIHHNANNFRGEVIGPIGAYVTAHNETAGRCLNNVISGSIRRTFVVEDDADYKLMLKLLKQKNIHRGIKIVNVGSSNREQHVAYCDHLIPGSVPLEQRFEAHPMALKALRAVGINRCLMAPTQTKLDDCMEGISSFIRSNGDVKVFMGEQIHQIKVSMYGNRAPFTQSYTPPNFKSYPMIGKKTNYRQEVMHLQERDQKRIEELERRITESDSQMEKRQINEEIQQLARDNKEASKEKDRINRELQSIRKRLQYVKNCQRDLKDVQAEYKHISDERMIAENIHNRDVAVQSLAECVKELPGIHAERRKKRKYMNKCQSILFNAKDRLLIVNDTIQERSLKITEHKQLIETCKKNIENWEDKSDVIAQEIQTAFDLGDGDWKNFQKIKIGRNQIPDEYWLPLNEVKKTDKNLQFKYSTAFMARFSPEEGKFDEKGNPCTIIPNDPNVIKNDIKIAKELVASQHPDPTMVDRYADRSAELQEVTIAFDDKTAKSENLESELIEKKNAWWYLLDPVINKVSKRFQKFMEAQNEEKDEDRSGRVLVVKDDTDFDPRRCGLVMHVKFRGTSGMRALDIKFHSGGERAISTMLFLLALQSVTPAPFRIVDEIDQGMDANNERRVFDTLFRINQIEEEENRQFIIVTPKLIGNLQYPPELNVTVHIPFNGAYVIPHSLWSLEEQVYNFRKNRGLDTSSIEEKIAFMNQAKVEGKEPVQKRRWRKKRSVSYSEDEEDSDEEYQG
eukprot:TRINITY_DN418_c0_g1_i3.p1 TRINITY_DN418_c0_g1~~TRINITY_DN418_c0_g1_i3.p1  ORF type:complete len:1170 (-),score=358.17 TRINITY_DN418_c0_g1_i3:527-4036(-)